MGVEFWRFGASPDVELRDFGQAAARFEDLGWDGLSIPAGIMPGARLSAGPGQAGTVPLIPLHHPFTALALAAASTTRLKLGTSTSAPTIHPREAAAGIDLLHWMSRGRMVHSFSRGDSVMLQTKRAGGITVGEFSRYLSDVHGYLRRDDTDERARRYGETWGLDWHRGQSKPPVNVSATGPKMTDLAARQADGISIAVGANPRRIARALHRVQSVRAAAGLSAQPFSVGCYVPVVVVTDGDYQAGRDRIRWSVHIHARFSAISGSALADVDSEDRSSIERIGASGHAMAKPRTGGATPHLDVGGELVGDHLVDRFAVVGNPDECAARLKEVAETGVDRILLLNPAPSADPEDRNSELLARKVLPLLR